MVCALLLQASADAQTVTATIPAGSLPFAVAVNPVTNQIYVANHNSNNVTVIDGATNTVCNTCTVAAGTTPYAVALSSDLFQSVFYGVTRPALVLSPHASRAAPAIPVLNCYVGGHDCNAQPILAEFSDTEERPRVKFHGIWKPSCAL